MSDKRSSGRYYTRVSPFSHEAFASWAKNAGLQGSTYIEPFAGEGHLIDMIDALGFEAKCRAFDILPVREGVEKRDTLADFPPVADIVITNPPYLAKNSARRRNLPFPDVEFDDLYKACLDEMLGHAGYVCAIVPESFLQSGLFLSRLSSAVSLNAKLFEDTEHPVCLAMFEPAVKATHLWMGDDYIGILDDIKAQVPVPARAYAWRFNDPLGALGLLGVDGQSGPSIKFVRGETIEPSSIKVSSRAITRISLKGNPLFCNDAFIDALNACLQDYRLRTHDILMTSFKGLRKDGQYRRRLDFAQARIFLDHVYGERS